MLRRVDIPLLCIESIALSAADNSSVLLSCKDCRTVLFTFALWASLPLGAVFQLIPWPTLKNVYSFVSGASPVRRDQISIVHVDRAPNASEEFVQRDRAYPRDLAPDDPSDDPSKRTKRTNPEPKTSRLALSPSPPR